MSRVKLELDGEAVAGLLLSAPNAIGMCTVRVRDDEIQRHVQRLTPLDPAAERLLGSGDRFVKLDAESAVASITTLESPRPKEWAISDLELLQQYAAVEHRASARGRQQGNRAKKTERAQVVLTVVRRWLKESRMLRSIMSAGLSEEDARNPIALLRAAKTAILDLRKRYTEKCGEFAPEGDQLVNAINDYLAHHAAPAPLKSIDLARRDAL